MSGAHLFSVRGARLVAAGRAILAAFLLAAVVLGAVEPGGGNPFVRPLLAIYLAYSVMLLIASRSRRIGHWVNRAPYLPSLVDLAAFTALLYATRGAESPFFSPLVFLVLSATVQWGSRGAILMGVAAVSVFLPAGLGSLGDGDRAALTTVVRLGSVSVVIGLLAAFARHQERVVAELARLSDPMDDAAGDAEPPVREGLTHALNVFNARRGVLVWTEGDEPYARAVALEDGRFTDSWLPPTGDDWLVDPDLDGAPFLYERRARRTVARRGARTTARPPLSAALMDPFPFERAVVIPVAADPLEGWILVLDHDEPASEDLAVGAMVGAQVSVGLQRWLTERVRRDTQASEERVRLARDLHDGVLQFLAGAALQMEGLLRGGQLPEAAQARLSSLRVAIGDEQRELRGFINAMRPHRAADPTIRMRLDEELTSLAERLSRYWGVTVSAEVTPRTLTVTDRMSYDIGRIVREAVANAVRHGQAAQVSVTAHGQGGGLVLQIDDDGQGFPFAGRRRHEDLMSVGGGPRSLQERVRVLQGRLSVDSTAGGASVTIEVPSAGSA